MKFRILSTARLSLPFASALAALLSAPSASAAVYYWDDNAAGANFGTAGANLGTWAGPTTGPTAGWSLSATGASAFTSYTTATTDTVNFGNGATGLAAGTISVSGTVNTGNMTFASGSGAITLSGGIINLGGSRTITSNNTGNIISSELALSGASIFNIGEAGGAVSRSLTLGVLSGTGGATFDYVGGSNGTGVIILNQASTYTGGTTIRTNVTNANTEVRLGVDNALPTTTVLTIGGADGAGGGRTTSLNMNGNDQTIAGLVNSGGGSLRTQRIFSSTAAILTIDGTTTNTFAGLIGNGGTSISLIKKGAGTQVLSGANTYTGSTTVEGGILRATTSTAALGAGALSLGGGTLQLAHTAALNFGRNTTVTATSTITADRTTSSATSLTHTLGTLSIGAQTLNITRGSLITGAGAGGITFANTTLTGTATLDTAANTVLTLGARGGDFLLTKQGAGQLILSSTSSSTAAANITAGLVIIQNATSLGTTDSNTVVSGTGTLFMGTASLSIAEALNLTGNGTGTNGALQFGGGVTAMAVTGAITLGGNALIQGDGSTGATLSGGINLGANALTYNVDGGATHSITTVKITGTGGSLTKTGGGTLNLTAANDYTGTTTISGGNLVTGLATNLAGYTGSGNVILSGGRLDVKTGDGTATGWSVAQLDTLLDNATKTSGSLGIDTTVASVTLTTDSLSGGIGLNKLGTNTLTLNQAHTYSGNTTISAGTLRLEDTGALGTSALLSIGANALQLATNAPFSGPAISIAGGTIVSDRLNSGTGVTHVLGNAAVSNTTHNFTGGANVNDGNAAIQIGSVSNASGSGGSATFNPTTANLTIAGGYTGLTNAGSNNLILGGSASSNSLTGNITLGSRVNINVSKTGNSVWTLSGTNNVSLGVGSTLTVSGGALITTKLAALPNSGAVTISGGTLGVVMGTSPANWSTSEVDALLFSATKTSGALGIDTTNGSLTQWADFTTTNLGSTLGLTKLGTNTLILNSTGNNYAGATTIGQGTLQLDVDHTLAGALTFGFGNGTTSPTGTLDLATTNVNATFGSLNVLTNSATANSITIGTGKTLQVNGAVTVGYNSTVNNSNTKLDVTGLGTLSIGTVGTATDANVQVGNGATSNISNAGTLDLSGLSTFYANLGTGTFRVGSTTNSGGGSTGGSTVILAADSTIRATSLIVASPDTSASIQRLKLGSGTNVLHVNDIFVAGRGPVNADGRGGGQLTFNEATGSLTIRGLLGGSTRANLSVASAGQNTANSAIGLFDSTGHTADLLLATLTVGARTTQSGGSTSNGTFNFDTGTLDADNLIAGFRDNGQGAIGTVNLSGGTSTFNNTTAAIVLGSNVAGGNVAFVATGTLNISGTANVTVAANAGTSIQLGNAVVLGTTTGAVNITGGSLTVAGDIVRGATTGTSIATVKISGGSLNMSGNDIGTLASAVTLTAESGTLSNVASINGTGGLTKTTAGTLTITGTNGYSGATLVSEGTLIVNGDISASSLTTVDSGATLGGSGIIGKTVINGTFSPGNSPGEIQITNTLSLNGTAILEIDGVAGPGITNGHDFVNLTGTGAAGELTYGGALTLDMGTVFSPASYSWDLFNMDSETSTFSTITLANSYSGSLLDIDANGIWDLVSGDETWQFTESTGILNLTVVPETSTTLLGALGALALLRRRRK